MARRLVEREASRSTSEPFLQRRPRGALISAGVLPGRQRREVADGIPHGQPLLLGPRGPKSKVEVEVVPDPDEEHTVSELRDSKVSGADVESGGLVSGRAKAAGSGDQMPPVVLDCQPSDILHEDGGRA